MRFSGQGSKGLRFGVSRVQASVDGLLGIFGWFAGQRKE